MNFNIPGLALFQSSGEWAVNGTNGLATFPGDPDYDQNSAAAKKGRTNPGIGSTPPFAGDTPGSPVGSSAIAKAVEQVQHAAFESIATKPSDNSFLGGLDVGRWVALVVGLICILGGVFLFKPVHDTVVTVAKTAADGAKVAAAAA